MLLAHTYGQIAGAGICTRCVPPPPPTTIGKSSERAEESAAVPLALAAEGTNGNHQQPNNCGTKTTTTISIGPFMNKSYFANLPTIFYLTILILSVPFPPILWLPMWNLVRTICKFAIQKKIWRHKEEGQGRVAEKPENMPKQPKDRTTNRQCSINLNASNANILARIEGNNGHTAKPIAFEKRSS
jgi:hypothetical protein